MAERIRKQKPAPQKREAAETVVPKDIDADALKAETDSLLDEIDGLLEENAEEFVKGYVQKGGQAVRVFIDTVIAGFRAPFTRVWRHV